MLVFKMCNVDKTSTVLK
ncbi:TPA: 23S rRNA methyltransferase attenuation leader peptide, partial [Streptococcus suis]|nr:23S rRNA methyltransferase attenuation leader peptide [Streptococcus suis]